MAGVDSLYHQNAKSLPRTDSSRLGVEKEKPVEILWGAKQYADARRFPNGR